MGVVLDSDRLGTSLIGLGGGTLVLGVVLPLVTEVELGPGGLKFKQSAREQEFRPVILAEVEQESLRRFAALLTGDASRTTDLVEEALARMYAVLPTVPAEERQANVLCVLVRLVLGASALGLPGGGAGGPATLRPAEEDDEAAAALSALAILSPYQRAVVLLRRYRDIDEDEIARVVDRPVGTVRHDLREAESKLEELLEGAGP
jgi:DNA-directed RNA polymerase specialized sigma24 family protein